MKAKKRLGQHFLTDNSVIAKIIAAIKDNCSAEQPLIEIGPGQGILTYELDETYPQFRAIEYDRDMIAILSQRIATEKLIQDNVLFTDLDSIFEGKPFSLVGNFPYNISSQIIFKMLENRTLVPTMVGMFQKEVAERICASPGSKKHGIISLRTQAFYEAELLFDIPPTAFNPPPRVQSAIIKLVRKADYEVFPCDETIFNRIIKVSFQQRRKKLRNTLKPFLNDLDMEILQQRPEQLGVKDFINIAQLIEKQNK